MNFSLFGKFDHFTGVWNYAHQRNGTRIYFHKRCEAFIFLKLGFHRQLLQAKLCRY